jgi:hypothetical protein
VKVGDLVRLKNQLNGEPHIGIVKSVESRDLLENVCMCIWNKPLWDYVHYNEGELVVISESK